MSKCPRFGSKKIKSYNYIGTKIIKCSDCNFDESKIYEVYPEQKTSQKAKGEYNIYKTGGSSRSRKK